MSNSLLISTFLSSLMGILGIFWSEVRNVRRAEQKKIQHALEKSSTPEEQNPKSEIMHSTREESSLYPSDQTSQHKIHESPSSSIPQQQTESTDEITDSEKTENTSEKTQNSSSPLSLKEQKDILKRAEVFLARKDFPEAEKLLIKILAFDANHPTSLQKLAYLYLQTEAHSKAETIYKQLLEVSSPNAGIHTNLGLALFHQKKFDESIDFYKQAIALEPHKGARYANLGQVFFVTKDLESAIECFQEACKKEPRNVEYLYLLADCLLEAKHFTNAKKTYERILDLSPYDQDAKEEVRRLQKLGF